MPQAGVLPGADGVLHPGLHPVRGVDVGGLPSQPLVAAGRFVAHRLYRHPSSASNRVSWAPGCGRSRRAKRRIVAGQAWSSSPAGPSRSSPVSSVTCASSIQQARWVHRSSWQASSARRSRTSPRLSIAICQACCGTSRSAVFSRSPSAQPTE